MGRSTTPVWLAIALLAATLVFGRLLPHGREGVLPAPLESFPSALGEWREGARDRWEPPARPRTASEALFRVYRNGTAPEVSLSIAYWKRQQPGEVAFTAKHAAPGREWVFVREDLARISTPSRWGSEFTVTRTLYKRGGERQLVTYWYIQPGRRAVGHRYWGRLYMLWDYVTRFRSDVAVIRVATRAHAGTLRNGFELHQAFLREALPALERYFAR
jgi:EpsI family protein